MNTTIKKNGLIGVIRIDKNNLIDWEDNTGLALFKEEIELLELDKLQKQRLKTLLDKWIIEEFVNVENENE